MMTLRAAALFGLLAGAMLLTRRLDWYRLGEPAGGDGAA